MLDMLRNINLVLISKSRADGPLCPDKFAKKFPGFSWACSPTVPVLAGHPQSSINRTVSSWVHASPLLFSIVVQMLIETRVILPPNMRNFSFIFQFHFIKIGRDRS